MLYINKHYTVNTEYGVRTVKAIQELESSDFYGVFSISNYKKARDSKGRIIPNNSPEATSTEAKEFENWFNQ